jgi:hypothetical protein
LDDLEPSIGSRAFHAGKAPLLESLQRSYKRFLRCCVVLGHSLGGAIAQQIAKDFVHEGLIAKVYHYNAPGIGFHESLEFLEKCNNSLVKLKIIEVRHVNDILSYFGGNHLPAHKRIFLKKSEFQGIQRRMGVYI